MHPIEMAERRLLPDWVIRLGIRRLLKRRLREQYDAGTETPSARLQAFVDGLRDSPLVVEADQANTQHYEVPAAFFEACLGKRLKYSCCHFPAPRTTLDEAEEAMLELSCERAEIEDGMQILDLGCGWGSLSLWMAQRYPAASIVAVSNSTGQRAFIESRRERWGLTNLEVRTSDIADFMPEGRFDRIVSIEMFEHLRNYAELMRRISTWLNPEGKLFVHIFCHRDCAYLFETNGAANWMGRHFFTGGMMPSEDLLPQFQDNLQLQEQWQVNGTHYGRTADAWLANLDSHRDSLNEVLARELPRAEARRQLQRWRMFFMAVAELFNYGGGEQWYVAHYRFCQKC